MNRQRIRPRLFLSHGPKKKTEFEQPPDIGSLSPDLQPCSPPTFCPLEDGTSPVQGESVQIGNYIVHQTSSNEYCPAINKATGNHFVCKVLSRSQYRPALTPYLATDGHPNVKSIWEVVLTDSKAYLFFERGYGDLHSYVREKKRLRQPEARDLARQVVDAVRHCHENGVVLRDLKLRTFVFKDSARTQLRLDGLDNAVVLDEPEGASDILTDKHGCPAYVSPEILSAKEGYSGKAADLWTLGVMLYTLLVGTYPFQSREPAVLFGLIRRCAYKIPPWVPARAKCLIRNLLQPDPTQRLSANEALEHPWLSRPLMAELQGRPMPFHKGMDQMVPDFEEEEEAIRAGLAG